ncbi:MAG: tRNA adenosine deaminase-associated protein [Actinobacteria bacterium]|nr:tRNA adenosine deaminase-associated protein [Actinomycetota bacterium]
MDEDAVDFALVAWREDGDWHAEPIPKDRAVSLSALEDFARRRQGESGSVVLVSVSDDFFAAMRIQGRRTRLLLSDLGPALEWELGEEIAERLELDLDDDEIDDLPDGEPAGDLSLLADYNVSADDLDLLCADLEMYPDEQVGSIAARIGFGELLGQVLEVYA